jgi:hypothetical protein
MFTNAILSGNLFKARAICWARLPCFTVGKQRKIHIAEFEDCMTDDRVLFLALFLACLDHAF